MTSEISNTETVIQTMKMQKNNARGNIFHLSGHMTFIQRRINVDSVNATLYKRHWPAGIYNIPANIQRRNKLVSTSKRHYYDVKCLLNFYMYERLDLFV